MLQYDHIVAYEFYMDNRKQCTVQYLLLDSILNRKTTIKRQSSFAEVLPILRNRNNGSSMFFNKFEG